MRLTRILGTQKAHTRHLRHNTDHSAKMAHASCHRAPQLDSAADRRLQDDRVRAGVERHGAEQLRGGQDDGERLQGALHGKTCHAGKGKNAAI